MFKKFLNKDNKYIGLSIVNEAFDSPLKILTKTEKDDSIRLVQEHFFEINGKKFTCLTELLKVEREFLLNFAQIIDDFEDTRDLNNLNKEEVLSVFSTILKIFEIYIDRVDYILIEATTDRKLSVYMALSKRFKNIFEIERAGPYEIEMRRRDSDFVKSFKDIKKFFQYLKN